MRLRVVERGHTLGRKVILLVSRLMLGARPPEVVRTLLYRPAFFGQAHGAWTNQVMRGPSAWSVAERELFATFTSKLNRCEF